MAIQKQFVKTKWHNDNEPAITEEQLDRIEIGIDTNEDNIIAIDGRLATVETEQKSQAKDISDVKSDLSNQSKMIADLAGKIGTVKFTVTEDGLLNVQEE